jgi:hypothetical protein
LAATSWARAIELPSASVANRRRAAIELLEGEYEAPAGRENDAARDLALERGVSLLVEPHDRLAPDEEDRPPQEVGLLGKGLRELIERRRRLLPALLLRDRVTRVEDAGDAARGLDDRRDLVLGERGLGVVALLELDPARTERGSSVTAGRSGELPVEGLHTTHCK